MQRNSKEVLTLTSRSIAGFDGSAVSESTASGVEGNNKAKKGQGKAKKKKIVPDVSAQCNSRRCKRLLQDALRVNDLGVWQQ